MRASFENGQSISPGHGLLAVGLETNWSSIKTAEQDDLHLRISPTRFSGLVEQLDFMDDKYIALIELPTKNYVHSQLVIGNLLWVLDSDPFTIKEGAVTYIGDVKVAIKHIAHQGYNDEYRSIILVKDESDTLRAYLDRNFADSLSGVTIDEAITPISQK